MTARPTTWDLECKLRAHPDWTEQERETSLAYRHTAGHLVYFDGGQVHVTAAGKQGMCWPRSCVCWHVAVRLYARQHEVPDLVSMLLPCQPAAQIPALVAELRSISTGFLP